ncbi:MAG: hypothetical protein EON47_24195, partial [Acetobacteraceae bacterium]
PQQVAQPLARAAGPGGHHRPAPGLRHGHGMLGIGGEDVLPRGPRLGEEPAGPAAGLDALGLLHPGKGRKPEQRPIGQHRIPAAPGEVEGPRRRRPVVAAWTRGSRERLGNLLRENGVAAEPVDDIGQIGGLGQGVVALAVLGLERGFVAPATATGAKFGLSVVGEQDLLGERIARPPRRRKRADQFIADATGIEQGDLVVHQDHGIGRYDGLSTIEVNGAPHDCLRLLYDGGDKLFLPVENIEVLSRFGTETAGIALDKLGGTSWQSRKAKAKQRIQDMAGQLIRIAAERQVKEGMLATPPEGAWDEFCARFPFAETEDQQRAIADVIEDLASGRPMDRL